MIIQLFTVYDAVAQAWLEPFHAPTVEFALRQFRSSVETEGHMFHKYPHDYVLYHVGSFDQKTGTVSGSDAPHRLAVGHEFAGSQQPLPFIDHEREEETN